MPLALKLFGERLQVPLLFHGFRRHEAAEKIGEVAVTQVPHHLGNVLAFEDFVSQPIDFLTLVVLNIVKFQQLLTDVVVAAFDLALRTFDHAGQHLRFDRHAVFEFQTIGNRLHAVAAENTQELIFHREVEDGTARVALAARTASELIVDTTGFMTFAADDAQPPRGHHFVMQLLPLGLHGLDSHRLVGFRQRFVRLDGIHLLGDTTTQHDVGTAAGHVGSNRHGAGTTGFQHHLRFAFVLLCVQHIVRNTFFCEALAQKFGYFNRRRTDQHRLTALHTVLDVFDDRGVLFFRRPENLVLLILADHLAVRRHHHGFEPVDVLEFVGFRIGGPRHTRQFLIHAEVVLERDGGHRLVFLLDLDAFLGFHGLMQTVRPTAPRHQAPRKFIHDHHFAVLNHVLLIPLKERMRLEGGIKVMQENNILG